MREAAILIVTAAGAVMLVRSTCALAKMSSRSAHGMRAAAIVMSVSAAAVVLAIYAGSWLREYGLIGMVVATTIRALFGRRPQDGFFDGDGA